MILVYCFISYSWGTLLCDTLYHYFLLYFVLKLLCQFRCSKGMALGRARAYHFLGGPRKEIIHRTQTPQIGNFSPSPRHSLLLLAPLLSRRVSRPPDTACWHVAHSNLRIVKCTRHTMISPLPRAVSLLHEKWLRTWRRKENSMLWQDMHTPIRTDSLFT